MIRRPGALSICILFLSAVLLCGCGEDVSSGTATSSGTSTLSESSGTSASSALAPVQVEAAGPVRDNTPGVLTPEASGTTVYANDLAVIDASHTDEGYFMVKYLGSNSKVKLRINGPNQSEYTYLLSGGGDYETFPFPCGNGSYEIQVFENISGDSYAVAHSADLSVTLRDSFTPFLYPNQYVNFTTSSNTVAKGSELARGAHSDLEVVENIYQYVISEIVYDDDKAASVSYGYLPVVDETLKSGKGICFDYAALMTAMLRSQRIPTKLEVGYSGDAYHAWISTWIQEKGWVDKIIEFDGSSWTLLDPTLAANNSSKAVAKYIGDGSNYTVKYSY